MDPICVISGYLNSGNRFVPFPAGGVNRCGRVILVHGWGVRAFSMNRLGKCFSAAGYDAWIYDYPSSKHGLFALGGDFLDALRHFGLDSSSGKIAFVTHSMGGLLLRVALSQMNRAELDKVGRIVMLAPPNQGSFWGDVAKFTPGFEYFNHSLRDLSRAGNSAANQIVPPPCPLELGIIGGKYDLKVASTRLPIPGVTAQYAEVAAGHGGLRNSETAFDLAKRFIAEGRFY